MTRNERDEMLMIEAARELLFDECQRNELYLLNSGGRILVEGSQWDVTRKIERLLGHPVDPETVARELALELGVFVRVLKSKAKAKDAPLTEQVEVEVEVCSRCGRKLSQSEERPLVYGTLVYCSHGCYMTDWQEEADRNHSQ